MKQVSVNGSMIDFSYHIVYEGRDVLPGEEIEVIDHNGNKSCLLYTSNSTIWM